MSVPDVPGLLIRPSRGERIGGLLALVVAAGIFSLAAASPVPLGMKLFFLIPTLSVAVYVWSVLTSWVELRGPTLIVRNPFGTRRLSRQDVVDVVRVVDRMAWRGRFAEGRRIAALELTAGGLLRLRGAPWTRSAWPLRQWLDFYGFAAGSDGGTPPDLGVGRQGWSGPVVP
jgi:hypothetical protein